MKKIIFLVIICAIVIFGYIIFDNILQSMTSPIDMESTEYIVVEIPAGSSTGDISEILQSHGLIRNNFVFKYMSKKMNYDGKYQAGAYVLGYSMSMTDIMNMMYKGEVSDNNTIRFTIPEGYTLQDTANALQNKGLMDAETFLSETKNGEFSYDFLEDIPHGPNRLEGFLFPDTYEVYVDSTPHEIIDKMLSRFDELFTEEFYNRANELGYSVKDIVTLASIIEREALLDSERTVVSSVFHNRLNIDMALQSCATVQYILGEAKPNLSIADTKIESPYNTYLHRGLPPGPIASPGLASLQAALYPADTNYMYFVAKGDGSHAFAETYGEFLKYKNQYR